MQQSERADVDRNLRWISLALAIIGIGIAGYLTWVHYDNLNSFCTLGGDCEKVQNSDYATPAGIPVALIGLIGYVIVFGLLLSPSRWRELTLPLIAITTTIGFGVSAYLTYLELFVIDAICTWCVASAIVMAALFAVSWFRLLRTV